MLNHNQSESTLEQTQATLLENEFTSNMPYYDLLMANFGDPAPVARHSGQGHQGSQSSNDTAETHSKTSDSQYLGKRCPLPRLIEGPWVMMPSRHLDYSGYNSKRSGHKMPDNWPYEEGVDTPTPYLDSKNYWEEDHLLTQESSSTLSFDKLHDAEERYAPFDGFLFNIQEEESLFTRTDF